MGHATAGAASRRPKLRHAKVHAMGNERPIAADHGEGPMDPKKWLDFPQFSDQIMERLGGLDLEIASRYQQIMAENREIHGN